MSSLTRTTVSREFYLKADRKDGLYREYNPGNGELVYEATGYVECESVCSL